VGAPVSAVRGLVSSVYKASAGAAYTFQSSADGNHLIVRGIPLVLIGTMGLAQYDPLTLTTPPHSPEGVGSIAPAPANTPWATEPSTDEILQRMEREFTMFASWLSVTAAQTPRLYFTGEPMLEVLWQTMMAGVFPNGVDAERALFTQWYQASLTLMNLILSLRESPWLRTIAVSAYSAYKATTGGFAHRSSFLFRTNYVTTNRAVFRTTAVAPSFGYAGLAPRGSRVGDMVVIVEGSDVPFVMRLRGELWELVGACYVHGIMGEQMYRPEKCVYMMLV